MLAKTMYERAMPDPSQEADRELRARGLELASIDRQAAIEERTAARNQRIQEIQMRLDDARTNAADKAALQREQAAEKAALQRELAQLRADTQTGIAQMGADSRAAAATAKQGAADEKIQSGREGVDTLIAQLRDKYDILDKGNGITDPAKGPIDNATAYVKSSGVGQVAGSIFGTENQSARNSIAQTRPLLLASLKEATGMSARQLDSNAELKLWLSAATDPKLDIQANREALTNIENFINAKSGAAPTAPADGIPTFATEAEAEAAGLAPGTPVIIGGVKGKWQ